MRRFRRVARLVLPVLFFLSLVPTVPGQVLRLAPHRPDPGAQHAALQAQQELVAGPDQFGTLCCQILQVPSSAFTPVDPSLAGTLGVGGTSVGYEVINPGSVAAQVWAPLVLPSGAGLDYLDLYYYDVDSTNDICVDLLALTGTTTPAYSTIATTCSELSGGSGYISSVASGTINNNVALGGGAQYVLMVSEDAPSSQLAFKAVDVWWHRQVSPAPGIATFNDVPTNHPFFQFVEALVASGITAGCQASPPLYCPDAPLTRKQMAAFLAKALGLFWRY